MKWNSIALYIIGLVLNLLLETVFLPHFNLFGIRPDTVIIIVVALGILRGSMTAGIYGLLAGLLIDLLYSPYLGMMALPYTVVGYIAGFFSEQYFALNPVVPALFAVIASLLKEGIIGIQVMLLGARYYMRGAVLRYFIPEAICTALLLVPVFLLLRRQMRKEWRRSRWDSFLGDRLGLLDMS